MSVAARARRTRAPPFASREVLRRVLRKEAQALISVPLFTEYEDVLARPQGTGGAV